MVATKKCKECDGCGFVKVDPPVDGRFYMPCKNCKGFGTVIVNSEEEQ